jgi:hypothetical protein
MTSFATVRDPAKDHLQTLQNAVLEKRSRETAT